MLMCAEKAAYNMSQFLVACICFRSNKTAYIRIFGSVSYLQHQKTRCACFLRLSIIIQVCSYLFSNFHDSCVLFRNSSNCCNLWKNSRNGSCNFFCLDQASVFARKKIYVIRGFLVSVVVWSLGETDCLFFFTNNNYGVSGLFE